MESQIDVFDGSCLGRCDRTSLRSCQCYVRSLRELNHRSVFTKGKLRASKNVDVVASKRLYFAPIASIEFNLRFANWYKL